MNSTPVATKRQQSADRTRRRAERTLQIAPCLWSNGHLSTLAWCSAGRPSRGIGPCDVEWLQAARRIIHAGHGRLTPALQTDC